ncbi:MAG: peptidoglycan-binding protein [Alphaproteobacteria bacterium]|nr:peptidoglycan-binding protein [Alphaproteobacteria bacterium]
MKKDTSAVTRAALLAVALALAACSQAPKPVATAIPEPPPAPAPLAAIGPPPAPDQDLVTDPRAIAAAQRALNILGYDVGKPDGVIGPATRRVLIAFQKDHALAEDGRLTFSLVERLKILTAELSRPVMVAVAAGDTLVYSDGKVEVAAAERSVSWEPQGGGRSLVAVRPSTTGWPAEAKAGLDWAVTHALDVAGPPLEWSSTGIAARFEIRTYPTLTPREAALAGPNAGVCHRFEMRSGDHRYPAIACPDAKGVWSIPHSHIRLARPASGLGPQAASLPAIRR